MSSDNNDDVNVTSEHTTEGEVHEEADYVDATADAGGFAGSTLAAEPLYDRKFETLGDRDGPHSSSDKPPYTGRSTVKTVQFPAYKINANVIPVFDYPASRWMRQVSKVLLASGISMKTGGPSLDRVLIPILLSKLPADLASVVPINSAVALAEFLQRYDGQLPGLRQFQGLTVKQDERPSIAYARMCDQVGEVWGKMPERDRGSMAWELVKGSLPPALKFDYSIAEITVPTTEQLLNMDFLYMGLKEAEISLAASRINLVNTQNGRSTSLPATGRDTQLPFRTKFEEYEERLSSLEKLIKNALSTTQRTGFLPAQAGFLQTAQDTSTVPGIGTSGILASSDKNRYCFYHSRFADRALKCTPPCAYSEDKAKGCVQPESLQPPRRLDERKQQHPNG